MSCPHAHDDGAYVLGTLSAAERAAFERHLAGCEECSRSVREIAGLPGLLARVSPDVLDGTREHEPVPDTLLPVLVAEVRRSRRRRAVASVLVAAAATVLVVGGTTLVVLSGDEDHPAAAPPPAPATSATGPDLQMSSVGSGSVTGWVSLTEVPWGTRLVLTCTYEYSHGHDYDHLPHSYEMFVRTVDGRVEQVASWSATPGEELEVPGASSVTPDQIVSVVVRTTGGRPVLRLAI